MCTKKLYGLVWYAAYANDECQVSRDVCVYAVDDIYIYMTVCKLVSLQKENTNTVHICEPCMYSIKLVMVVHNHLQFRSSTIWTTLQTWISLIFWGLLPGVLEKSLSLSLLCLWTDAMNGSNPAPLHHWGWNPPYIGDGHPTFNRESL